jgi:copper homeostasis protein
MHYKLEVIGFNIASCLIAQEAGAHRIELCDNPPEGGTTPSYSFIKMAREKLSIELYCMIRPRGGDFYYSDTEFIMMQEDVKVCKNLGCDGIVIGILNKDGTINKQQAAKLVELAYPMGVTFHRAFDHSANPFEALEDIINIGCERILTSGQQPTAGEGLKLINELVRQADDRIIIMPGSGVRAGNIIQLLEKSGAEEFHSSARKIMHTPMQHLNPGMQSGLDYIIADEEEIKNIISKLKNHRHLHEE